MPFGQLVIGPPGSGKTTYCNGVSQYLTALGRKVSNLSCSHCASLNPSTTSVQQCLAALASL